MSAATPRREGWAGEVTVKVLRGLLGAEGDEQWQAGIERAMGELGRKLGVERVWVVVVRGEDTSGGTGIRGKSEAVGYEWVKGESDQEEYRPRGMKMGWEETAAREMSEGMGRWTGTGAGGDVVRVSGEDWPVELEGIREAAEQMAGARTMLMAPVRGEMGEVIGLLAAQTSDSRRLWSNAEAEALVMTAALAGCWIVAQQTRGALADRDKLLEGIAAGIPGLAFQFYARDDGGMGFHYLSPQFLQMFGPVETWYLGKHVHEGDRERMLESVHAALRDEREWMFEGRWRMRSGETHWFEGLARPTRREREVVYNGLLLDITERKQAEEAMRKARDEAEAANRAKDFFLAAVSHELRTPLTPILLISSSLERDAALSEEVRRDMAEIREHVEIEKRLIADLLDFTAIRMGKMAVRRRGSVSVREVLRKAIEVCGAEAVRKEIELVAKLGATNDALNNADEDRLRQVFWNVIQNAVKFTTRGGRVEVRTSDETGGGIRIDVEDTGLGMDATALGRLFMPFEQGSHGDIVHHGGVGLGMAIAKGLMDAHGGKIWAQSEGKGMGTTFTMVFPETGMAEMKSESAGRRMETSEARDEGQASGRVLVVEDHPATLRLMKEVLETEGYTVLTASTKVEAIRVAEREEFDLVVCDIGLPDGSGLDVMKEVRRKRPGVKGVAVSGYGAEKDVEASRGAGFEEHLVKPVELKVLRDAVRKGMQKEKN